MKTASQTFDEVCPLLGGAYEKWKVWQGKKDEHKLDFFRLADEAIEEHGRQMRSMEISAATETEAVDRVKRHNPGWLVVESRSHPWKAGAYEVVIMEDPSLQPFSVDHDGVTYARIVRKGPVMIDDEWLSQEDPELYEAVTYQLPWGIRIVIPIDQLDKDLIGRVGKYIYTAAPRVSLAAPRAIKDESE